MDIELVKILRKECKCRAAANVGEERRFFQSLVNVLGDAEECECGSEDSKSRLLCCSSCNMIWYNCLCSHD